MVAWRIIKIVVFFIAVVVCLFLGEFAFIGILPLLVFVALELVYVRDQNEITKDKLQEISDKLDEISAKLSGTACQENHDKIIDTLTMDTVNTGEDKQENLGKQKD